MKQGLVVIVTTMSIIALAPVPVPAAPEGGTAQQVTYGVGSVLGTLVYAPFKATFCILGTLASGATLPIAGTGAAGKVATTTCGGTWAITPDVLRGNEPVRFIGGGSASSKTAAR